MARIWKQLGLFILIVACLFNITTKLVSKTPLDKELQISSDYIKPVENVTNLNLQ